MTDTNQNSSSATTKPTSEWPIRGRFQKKFEPYGVRICEDTLDEIREYDDCTVTRMGSHTSRPHAIEVLITTREGALKARPGDWVMEDSEGSHYPIAAEEIRQTYEPVNQDEGGSGLTEGAAHNLLRAAKALIQTPPDADEHQERMDDLRDAVAQATPRRNTEGVG